MEGKTSGLVNIDGTTLGRWRIQLIRRRLMEHPLLRVDRRVEPGKGLEANGRVRMHGCNTERFDIMPWLHSNSMPGAETPQQVRRARSWMSAIVQTVAGRKALADSAPYAHPHRI